MEPDALGHAPGGTAYRAGHVRAVSIAVIGSVAIAERGEVPRGPATEVRVARHDARVDDVRMHPGAGAVVAIAAVQRQIELIDAVQAPRRIGLGGHGVNLAILHHEVHFGIGRECARRRLVGPHREAAQRVGVRLKDGGATLEGERLGDLGHPGGTEGGGLQHDDVLPGDGIGGFPELAPGSGGRVPRGLLRASRLGEACRLSQVLGGVEGRAPACGQDGEATDEHQVLPSGFMQGGSPGERSNGSHGV